MPLQFNGLKNVGKRHQKVDPGQSSTSKATLSWLATLVTADGAATSILVPGYGNINGWQFDLNPINVQSSFTFGDAKAMQLAIRRSLSALIDATHQYLSGRTIIYVQATGQLFVFGQTPIVAPAEQIGAVTECCIVPCDSIATGIISIFIEADQVNGALVAPGSMAQTGVNLTLFNFEVPPVGAL